jgi:hypothetical protein
MRHTPSITPTRSAEHDPPRKEVGEPMPKVQGLSKAEANYRKAENPKFSCHECAFMLPRLSIGGCRFVRGVIHAEDTCDEFKPKAATA